MLKKSVILVCVATLLNAVTACAPDAGLSVAFDKIQGVSPSGSSTPSSTAAPAQTRSPLRIEAEKAVKTAGSSSLKYPVSEARSNGEEVLMFSGGDAGSQATLTLPELKGAYQIKIHWLNSSDSPALEIGLDSLSLDLPDHSSFHTNGQLQNRDLGRHDLNLPAGSPLTMTVKGDQLGKGNAWIAIDYFEFTPLS